MVEPRIVPREEHPISRRDIDPDALKVLYRLRQGEHAAYLVGGSVRDLLLGRRPKDFDIGTSAHPYQVKKLFRNCWIIGRRFRLAHVKFGPKVIEVATFRRQVAAGEEVVQDGVPAPDPTTPEGEQLIHHDNTFGTPEEDAFRRDFTINALAYDIATFSIIDYVGGLEDLRAGIVRSIGDPDVRLNEDPVRMIRAIAIAARLDFTIEPSLLQAIRTHRHEIAKSSLPRLLEEYYKILRAGLGGEGVPPAGGGRAARADLDRAAPRRRRSAVALARRGRRLPPPVRVDARHAVERDPARQPAGAAGHLAAPAARAGVGRRRQAAAPSAGAAPRRSAARAPRRRAAAPDHQPAAPPARSDSERARAAIARAPRHLPRSADVDGDPRRLAGGGRALDGDPRRGRGAGAGVGGQRRRGRAAAGHRARDAAQKRRRRRRRGRRGGGGAHRSPSAG